ncbi:hypothetical protein [Treponema sp.]|uniref:hypothetical protein n=1 Tax=Treponema sp. TaxID=166 RepID=UPI003EFF8D36
MRKGKDIFFILLFVFSTFNLFSKGKRDDNAMNQVEQYFIPKKTLKNLEKQAMEGSVEAALKVWEYYSFSALDYEAISIWEIILCENELSNNSNGTYNYAIMLLSQKSFEKERGWYWIRRCKNADFLIDDYLDNLYKELELKNDIELREKSINGFSKMNYSEIRQSAHYGNKDAAYYLYTEKMNDFTEQNQIPKNTLLLNPEYDSAVYWLRIGAQNGNEECIRKYIDLLKKSSNKYDNIRASFWEKKL